MASKKLSGEVFYPSNEVIEKAHIKDWDELDKRAKKDYSGFWESMANELHWFKKWDKVVDDSEKPFYKWFTGAKTNIVYNCLDTHVKTHRRNKLALIWEGENGDSKTMSYYALHRETCKFANVLQSMGVKKGDRVTIYMGRIPEIMIAATFLPHRFVTIQERKRGRGMRTRTPFIPYPFHTLSYTEGNCQVVNDASTKIPLSCAR